MSKRPGQNTLDFFLSKKNKQSGDVEESSIANNSTPQTVSNQVIEADHNDKSLSMPIPSTSSSSSSLGINNFIMPANNPGPIYNFNDSETPVGFFEGHDLSREAFMYAAELANSDREEKRTLVATPDDTVLANDPYLAINGTCSAFNTGVTAVFGPSSLINIDAVQSICDEKEVPHILTRWLYNPVRSGTLINFYPHSTILSNAYLDIIKSWKWKSFTVLYEDNESLLRVSNLILSAEEMNMIVTIEQLDKDRTGNYRPALKRVWRSEQKFFVIDCSIEHLYEVLIQCQQIGMMTSEYNYLITNLDAHTVKLTPFFYSETNITGIRLINPKDEYVMKISANITSLQESNELPSWKLTTNAALVIDAIQMFSKVLTELEDKNLPLNERPMSCYSAGNWAHGYTIHNLLKSSSYEGLTGHIEFNNEGFRDAFILQIYEIGESGLANVGTWNSSTGINITKFHIPEIDEGNESIRNKSFTVIIALTPPYAMLKQESKALTGNDRFEGFAIDLISELAAMEGFNYTFIVRDDGKNGNIDENGEWSGMIGDVINKKADLAITDLTITSGRNKAVDFTSPFMTLGISILFKKPSKAPPNFFSFAAPFALDTWIAMAVGFVVVSLSFFVLGRICPDEWNNPYPCIEEPEFLVNQFSLANAVWFVTGAMLQQGSEIAPIAIPTRLVSGVWWFFILIMVASYTANLASFLVTENTVELFSDLNELLSNQEEHKLRWGAKANGSTADFFMNNKNDSVKMAIGKYMKEHPEDMVNDNDIGVARAEREDINYAFFMESTSIEYAIQRHCTLKMVGERLDEKGYGIAMRKNATYRNTLSTAILKLQASGFIEKIRKRWWEERRGGGLCKGSTDEAEATPLDLKNVEGVFLVTIYGTILAAVCVMIEYVIDVFKMSRRVKKPFLEIFRDEMKHYINFNSETKPTLAASESRSGSENDVNEKSEENSKSKSMSRRSENDNGVLENGVEHEKISQYGFIVTPSRDWISRSNESSNI